MKNKIEALISKLKQFDPLSEDYKKLNDESNTHRVKKSDATNIDIAS